MRRKDIKEILRKEKKKKLEIPKEFYNDMAVFCLDNELHIVTIYKLLKVKNIQQMLETMFDEVVKEYSLHVPTIEKLNTSSTRESVNNEFKRKGLKYKL